MRKIIITKFVYKILHIAACAGSMSGGQGSVWLLGARKHKRSRVIALTRLENYDRGCEEVNKILPEDMLKGLIAISKLDIIPVAMCMAKNTPHEEHNDSFCRNRRNILNTFPKFIVGEATMCNMRFWACSKKQDDWGNMKPEVVKTIIERS